MDYIILFDLLFLLVGLITGAGGTKLIGWLRRFGALICIEVSPSTHRYRIAYRRPRENKYVIKTRAGKGDVPLVSDHIWHHEGIGPKLVLVDTEIALPLDVESDQEAAKDSGVFRILGKTDTNGGLSLQMPVRVPDSKGVHLDGFKLQEIRKDTRIKQIQHSSGLDLETLAKYALVGLCLVLIAVLGMGFVIIKTLGSVPGTGGH